MLAAILIWSYCFLLSLCVGCIFFVLIGSKDISSRLIFLNPFLTVFVGLAVLSFLVSTLSLFIRIGLTANLLICMFILLSFWFLKPWKRFRFQRPFANSGIFGVMIPILVLLLTLVNALRLPTNPDTALYHAQTIHWIETWPAVPGLGNLHARFGYNSSWYVLNAFFSFSFLGGRSLHLLSSFFFLTTSLYLLDKGLKKWNEGSKLALFLNALLVFFLQWIYLAEISSPGNDLPAALLCFIVFTEWQDFRKIHFEETKAKLILIGLLVLWAITIKLSVLPLGFFLVWVVVVFYKKIYLRHLLFPFLLVFLTITPWLMRSLIQTGYLVYPHIGLGWFEFDWQIPTRLVEEESAIIRAWARLPGVDVAEVLQMSMREWIPLWFQDLTRNQQWILYALAIFPVILFVFRLAYPKMWQNLRDRWKIGLFSYLLSYAGLLFCFLTAPSLRFAYGFILYALAFNMAIFGLAIYKLLKLNAKYARIILMIFMLITFLFSLQKTFDQQLICDNWLAPADYEEMPFSACEFGNFTGWCGDYMGLCWYEPFPCAPVGNPDVYQRGESLGEGFRHAQP